MNQHRVSTELAAQKNVDMERAKYDLEEHQWTCVSALRSDSLDLAAQGNLAHDNFTTLGNLSCSSVDAASEPVNKGIGDFGVN